MMFAVKNYEDWRAQASQALRAGVEPQQIRWIDGDDTQQFLFEQPAPPINQAGAPVRIPRAFLKLAETAARHVDPGRWAALYRVVWRLSHGERQLLENPIDDDLSMLDAMCRAVDKDIYQMRQFVRFRRVQTEEGDRYIA